MVGLCCIRFSGSGIRRIVIWRISIKTFENKVQEFWYLCSIWWLQRFIVNKSTWAFAKRSNIVCRHKQNRYINASHLHKKILFAKYSQQDRVDQNSSAEVYRNWQWKWTECWWCRCSCDKKSAWNGKAPSNDCCMWRHRHSSVTGVIVSLVLHNEGYRVRYEQKCQQQEGTRGIFSEGCREQAAPNTIPVVCPGLDRLWQHLSNPKSKET